MIKEYQQYRALIAKLEDVNKNKSSVYRFRLGALAALGYLFIAIVLTVLILICVGMINMYMEGWRGAGLFKLFIISLVFIFYLIRALWVTIPAPTGMQIHRKDAPELFKELDSISTYLQAPKFNVVLMDEEMNAAVMQVPRLGIFGMYKNYLIIGLPLMQALSLTEFRAIMVHELGHISGKHGKFGNWIWRLRTTFAKIQDSFEQSGAMNLIFNSFFKWYAPLFMAYSSVLQRANEYEADQYSVKYTSPEAFAQGLSKVAIRSEITMHETWKAIQAEILNSDTAPTDIYTRFSNELSKNLPDTAVEKLQKAMKLNTDIDDSHPCLRDRFTAIGLRDLHSGSRLSMLLQKSGHSAASTLLGSTEKTFEMKLNQSMKEMMDAVWKIKYDEAMENKKKLDELNAKDELTEDETWEKITVKSNLYGTDGIKDEILALLEKWPGNLDAKFAYGTLLLDDDDEKGVGIIKEVMREDDRYHLYGNSHITSFLNRQGRSDEAEIFITEGMKSAEKLEMLHKTVSGFNAKDEYLNNTYSQEELNPIIQAVSQNKHIHRAYLVRKKVDIDTKIEHHLLIIKPKYVGMVWDKDDLCSKMIADIESAVEFKDVVYISVLEDSTYKYVFKKLDKLSGAMIYEKTK